MRGGGGDKISCCTTGFARCVLLTLTLSLFDAIAIDDGLGGEGGTGGGIFGGYRRNNSIAPLAAHTLTFLEHLRPVDFDQGAVAVLVLLSVAHGGQHGTGGVLGEAAGGEGRARAASAWSLWSRCGNGCWSPPNLQLARRCQFNAGPWGACCPTTGVGAWWCLRTGQSWMRHSMGKMWVSHLTSHVLPFIFTTSGRPSLASISSVRFKTGHVVGNIYVRWRVENQVHDAQWPKNTQASSPYPSRPIAASE